MTGFRRARPTEAPLLSELAVRSRAYWGYPLEFMHACRDELSVDPESIDADGRFYETAIEDDRIAGFYTLDGRGEFIELEALFVEPEHIGKGIGRQLIDRARRRAVELGARILTIQGDPHALEFYLAAGAVVVGERESDSIRGRMLPLLEIDLRGDAHGDGGGRKASS